MNTLTEISEFVEYILRLDLDTPIRGFDGTDIGPANEQAQTLANRTLWLKKKLNEISEEVNGLKNAKYVASVNKETGNLFITYENIGAAAKEHDHTFSDIETDTDNQFVSQADKKLWNEKQDKLVSGETLKTVLGMSLLGNGNVTVGSKDIMTDDDFQFISSNDRGKWNGKQSQLISGENIKTLHGETLLGSEDIKLTYKDVGGDKKGAGSEAVNIHISAEDPHNQYLTKDRGSDYFINKNLGNKPSGFLQLDENGNIPAELADLFKARYIIADDKEERLKITEGGDMTICLQLDENIVYYLDGGAEPSIDENWKKGRSTDPINIISVFGRTGAIVSANGDYNTDQITETENKLFTTPDEKKTWNNKQEKLVSGESIKSINGDSVLGKGDIEITPSTIKAAKESHNHSADDIKTTKEKQFISEEDRENWDNKQSNLVSGKDIKTINNDSLLGEGNISITPSTIKAAEKTHNHSTEDIETDDSAQFVSSDEKKTWNNKQDNLKSGTNIKSINGDSVLGVGDIEITPETIKAAKESHKHGPSDIETDTDNQFVSQADKKLWNEKQTTLVSGENISTVFGKSLLTDKDISLKDIEDLEKIINEMLVAGDGIEISFDEETKTIKITNTGNGGETAKPDPIRVIDVKDEEGGRTFIYRAEKTNYDFLTYALKKNIASEAEVISYNYEKVPADIPHSELPVFDDYGYIPDSSDPVIYPLESVTTDYETYSTEFIQSPTSKITRIDLNLGGNGKGIIPPMTSPDPVGKFTVFASEYQEGYEIWKSFQYNKSLGVLSPKTYWRSPNAFQSENLLPSVGVVCTEPFIIDSFGLQDFAGFDSTGETATTYPTTIWLQGRNSSDERWSTLEQYNNVPLINTGKGWNVFTMSSPKTYKEFQLLFRNAANRARNVGISRLQFYNGIGGLIKSVDGNYYTVDEDNNLVNVIPSATMFTDHNFGATNGSIPISDIKDMFPIKICSNGKTSVTITYFTTSKQILLNYPLETTNIWSALNDLMVSEVYDESDKLSMKTAITIDGSEYFIFKNERWVSIGELTNDSNSAEILDAKGMLFLTFSAITSEQWALLFNDGEITYKLGIAYSSKIETKNDAIAPKTLNASFDEVIQWLIASKEDVIIFFQGKKIGFTTTSPGDYKFCYKFN